MKLFTYLEGQVGDIVVDADGEVMGAFTVQVIEDRLDMAGGEVLGGESLASADNSDVLR